MPLVTIALLAVIEGLAEVLPISGSGHGEVARLWLEQGSGAGALEPILHAGTLAALVVLVRRRLRIAIGEGVRAIARPELFRTSPAAHDAAVIALAVAASMAAAAAARPFAEVWNRTPIAIGCGLLATALAVASTALAPRGRVESPSLFGAALVGAAHGLATFPGASRVGAALTLLLWLGVRPTRAVELSFLVTIPTLAVSLVQGLAGARTGIDLGAAALGVLIAFLAASIAGAMVHALSDRRRLALLSLWLVPLGLATIAYARAVSA